MASDFVSAEELLAVWELPGRRCGTFPTYDPVEPFTTDPFARAAARAGYKADRRDARPYGWWNAKCDYVLLPAEPWDIFKQVCVRDFAPDGDRYLRLELVGADGKPGWATSSGPDYFATRVRCGAFVLFQTTFLWDLVEGSKHGLESGGRGGRFARVPLLDAVRAAAVALWVVDAPLASPRALLLGSG